MNKTLLKLLWAIAFALCACLGLIPAPEGAMSVLMMVLGVLCFLPPALLLYQSWKDKDPKTLELIGLLSGLSLTISLVLMVGNFLCVLAPDWVGSLLYWALAILGTPMACLQNAYVSLFLWAILLFASLEGRKEAKR